MHIDKAEFERVARAVIRLNKYNTRTEEDLVKYMIGMVYADCDSAYTATGGFMLTFYNHPTGERACKPSVSDILFD